MTSPTQNPEKPFPFLAWYLRNGKKNASDAALERAELSCERWTWGCGALVVLGVAFEVAIAFANPAYGTGWEHWGPTGANLLVATGVAGEVIFAAMGFSRARELQVRAGRQIEDSYALAVLALGKAAGAASDAAKANRDLAEAIERAAALEGDNAKLRAAAAWRHLPLETVRALGTELAKIPPSVVAFVLTVGDAESRNFAREFEAVFKHCGWESVYVVAGYTGDPVYGIRISVAFTDERRDLGMRLREAFKNAGIEFIPGEPPAAFMTTPSSHPPAGKMAVIYVGPRGEPKL